MTKSIKTLLGPALTIIGVMVVSSIVLMGVVNAAPLSEVVTENTSHIVYHGANGDHVTLLRSGKDNLFDMTAKQVCAADNVITVSMFYDIANVVTIQCK